MIYIPPSTGTTGKQPQPNRQTPALRLISDLLKDGKYRTYTNTVDISDIVRERSLQRTILDALPDGFNEKRRLIKVHQSKPNSLIYYATLVSRNPTSGGLGCSAQVASRYGYAAMPIIPATYQRHPHIIVFVMEHIKGKAGKLAKNVGLYVGLNPQNQRVGNFSSSEDPQLAFADYEAIADSLINNSGSRREEVRDILKPQRN